MGSSALAAALAAAAVGILLVLLVPARLARATALSLALVVAVVGATLTAGSNVSMASMASMAFGSVLLGISIVRVRSSSSGERLLQGVLCAWWVLAMLSTLIMHGRSVAGMLVFGTFALLVSHVALHLDRASVRFFVRVALAVMVVEVALAALEFGAGMQPLWGYLGDARANPLIEGFDRAQGTFGHPIVFGWFLAVCATLVWVDAGRLSRRLCLTFLVVVAAGLVLSGTRSAMVSFAVGVILHLVMRPGLATWMRNLLIAGGAVFVVLAIGVGSRISELTADLLDSGSWTQRIGNMARVPDLLARPPMESLFGVGWGRDDQLFVEGDLVSPFNFRVVDNMLVEALGTVGILGLLVLIVMVVIAFVRGDRASRAVTATIAAMMFSFDTMVWPFTAIALMLFFSLPRLNRNAPPERPEAVSGTEQPVTRRALNGRRTR